MSNDFFDELNEVDTPLEKQIKDITNFKDDKLDETIKKIETKSIDTKEMSLPSAFVNCSILGFITLFAGIAWFVNLMHQITI